MGGEDGADVETMILERVLKGPVAEGGRVEGKRGLSRRRNGEGSLGWMERWRE